MQGGGLGKEWSAPNPAGVCHPSEWASNAFATLMAIALERDYLSSEDERTTTRPTTQFSIALQCELKRLSLEFGKNFRDCLQSIRVSPTNPCCSGLERK